MRFGALASLLLVTACADALEIRHLTWPTLGSEVRSAIVAITTDLVPRNDTERFRIEAFPIEALSTTPIRLDFDESPALIVDLLTYPEDLETLGIPPGRLERITASDPSRALPIPPLAYRYLDSGGASAWVAQESLSDELLKVRIRPFDPFACLERLGCPRAEGRARCVTPCGPTDAPAPPMPPTSPALPEILGVGCGTTSTLTLATLDLGVCEPPLPDPGCGPAEAQPPNQDACVAIGSPCPARWAPVPSAGVVLFVDDDAAPNGDGSAAAPWSSISVALGNAPDRATIAIARGRYVEQLSPRADVELLGACTADTVIDASGGIGLDVVGPLRVRGLRIEGGAPGIMLTDNLALLELDEVAISGGEQGLVVPGGRVTANALLVRSTGGGNVAISAAGSAELSRTYLETSSGAALNLTDGGELTADQLVIRRPRSIATAEGVGLAISGDAHATITRSLIEGTVEAGILAVGASTAVDLDDVLIRDGEDTASHVKGFGIYADDRVELRGRRLLLLRTRSTSLHLSRGATGVFEDLTIKEQLLSDPLIAGAGIAVSGSELEVHRGMIDGTDGAGLANNASRLFLEDLDINAVGRIQRSQGISTVSSELRAARLRIRGGSGLGFTSDGRDSQMIVSDLEITDSGASAVYLGGIGDSLTGDRLALGPSGQAAFVGTGDTHTEVRDLWAHGAKLLTDNRTGAVIFKEEAAATLDRFLIEDCPIAGLDIESISGQAALKTLRNGVVRRNRFGLIWRAPAEKVPLILENVSFRDNDALAGPNE